MADNYTVEYTPSEGGSFAPAPAGTQQLVCVDGIYLGERVESYQGAPPKIVKKYAYVFQTLETDPETGKRYEVSKEFTISMHESAGLRKFLSAWRGRSYTDEEARHVELHKPIGANGLGTIEHKQSANGRTYGRLTNIAPLLKGMTKIEPEGYARATYWEDRKRDYAAGVELHRAQTAHAAPAASVARPAAQPTAAAASASSNGMPAALADVPNDGLPF